MVTLDDSLPSALHAAARWDRLGPAGVPAMLVHPSWEDVQPRPFLVWMHGRTVTKEVDPGRYLRMLRAGIGVCAVDLPGHGERFDSALQQPDRAYDVVMTMLEEIDGVTEVLIARGLAGRGRVALGGMSAGGMAALARLCRPHEFACCSVEATTGSWMHQRKRAMFAGRLDDDIAARDPVRNLSGWREIPLQAIHSRLDQWIGISGQAAFIEALRRHYARPEAIEFVQYDQTGAPFEHMGFGRLASDAKNRQREFLVRCLEPETGSS